MIHPPLGLTLTRTTTAPGYRCGSGGSATDRGTATHILAPKCRAWPAAQHQPLQPLVTKALLGCLGISLVVTLPLKDPKGTAEDQTVWVEQLLQASYRGGGQHP